MNESQIFADALKLAVPSERAAYLDGACAGDARLRAGVEALLRAHDTDLNFLERPVGPPGVTADKLPTPSRPGNPGNPASQADGGEQAGVVLAGRYQLLELIGEGGMGSVWMAQQTEPVKRLVAVKLIKPGMDSKQVLVRFEAERQALAIMDHPNIATILDGGITPAGRPFFVMELVKGQPVTAYCDEHRLTPQERLTLFVSVCEAVQHAHQKGVIHRDLKPSNVLVAPYDGKPVIKVIDFGVAKATGPALTERTLFTGFGTVVGTVEYMSPEQAELNNHDVDIRSDVYSLGVLLYELLTGSTPLGRERLAGAAFAEMLRRVREEEPPKPSTRLSDSKATLSSISAQRRTEPARLTRLVRGELDWIVMKALEKDRSRRYETANGFVTDVRRYLADETVLACPPSAGYRLRKFARRNKRALAALTLVGFMLIAVVVTLAVANVAIRDEQRQTKDSLQSEAEARRELQQAHDRERRDSYGLRIALARQEWLTGDLDQAKRHLAECLPEMRDQDWYRLHRSCQTELLRVEEAADCVVFSPDRRCFVTSTGPGQISVRDTTTGETRAHFTGSRGIVGATLTISRDGKQVICVSSPFLFLTVKNQKPPFDPGIQVTVLELATGKKSGGFTQDGTFNRAAVSPDGRRVALGFAKTVIVYDIMTGRELFRHDADVKYQRYLAFLEDGRSILAGSSDQLIRLSERAGEKPILALDLRMRVSLHALSGDSRTFATFGLPTDNSPACVKVWDLPGSQEIATLPRQSGTVTALALHPDGRWLALGSSDNSIRVWDTRTRGLVFELRGHTGAPRGLAFSADGCRLVSAGADQTVRIWDTSSSD